MKPTDRSAAEILAKAIELTDPAARRAYVDRTCAGDEVLRQEVGSLLAAHEQASGFMNTTAMPGSTHALPTEQAGDRIGRYKLLEQIGEGGFGVVWMAEQEEPVRRRVALKIIKLGMDTKEVVARFEAERQALAMMDHPNIAKVFDGGAIGAPGSEISNLKSQMPLGRPYFVMELVKGIPITEYCDAAKLPTAERLDLFMQVCQAVQHAHQKGVIHRDLKPSNVLVTVQDDRPVPKVIDFGVAKATQARLTEKTLFTKFNQWIGTPTYMSPEQAGLGSLDVDTRSDVYSLGVLLYELLTGRPPFDTQKLLAAGYDAVMRTIREEEPPRPSTRLSTLAAEELSAVAAKRGAEPARLHRLVRGDLDWIVMKALEKDRARRYETASDFAADLQRHLSDEPVVAAAPDLVYRTGKFLRRHRSRLAFATLALTVVTLAVVGGKFALNDWSARQTLQASGTNAVFALTKSDDVQALRRWLDANPSLVNERDADGSTPLIYAAGAGTTNTLSLLIARGATVDATNHTGWTALGIATGYNRTAAALMLLAAGADPNRADASDGITPLHLASWFGAVEIGGALLAKGARTEAACRPANQTALGQAAMAGHADFVDLLLASGAIVEPRDAYGHTPLHLAAMGPNMTTFVRFWKEKLVTLTHRGSGDAGLDQAVAEMANRAVQLEKEVDNRAARLGTTRPAGLLLGGGEHARVAEALLAHGAALEATNRAGRTPLWLAAESTNEAVAQVLIVRRANLNARDADGLTPLHLTVARNSRGLVARLLDAGADPNLLDAGGFTPLNTAVERDQRALAELLLTHRANPNLALPGNQAHPAAGQTPLHTAAMGGNVDLLGLLLDHGAFINASDGRDAPLSWAVQFGRTNAIDFLLKRGAQPNIAALKTGRTALHWAALLGQLDAARKLLQHGASNNVPAQMGTPLHAAAAGPEAARSFLQAEAGQPSENGHWAQPHIGSAEGYLAVLKLLLDSGADPNGRDPFFQTTPLFPAVRGGNLAAVETLLAAGADVKARDSGGATPLHAVAKTPAAAVSNIVSRLLKAGADPDARDDHRGTPLHAAANAGRPEAAARLIAADAGVNAPGPLLNTPLHLALQRGSREVVELLLAHHADPNRGNREGATALHVAVGLNSKEFVTLLFPHDADPNAATLDGTTPLMLAARKTDLDMVRLLLAHGARLDAVDQGGRTALHAAAAGESVAIVKFLLEQGARLEHGDPEGNTAVMTAAKSGRLEVLQFFLDRGAPLTEHDHEGVTLLHGAADHGHAAVVEYLLGRGLDVNARSTIQYTPLHYAANGYFTDEGHYVAVIRVLLARGADVNARTRDNQTPLHHAAGWGRPKILEALLAAGADPRVRDNDGKTALDIARVSADPRLRPGVGPGRKACAALLAKAASDSPPDPSRNNTGP